VAAIASIGINMTNANSVLADEGGFQDHIGDSHSGSEHSETCISVSCCHHCGSDSGGGGGDDN
jgi:hypothetical protein